MNDDTTSDLGACAERLFAEVEAYLAVVDAMRREGIEPRWAGERCWPSLEGRASGARDGLFLNGLWGC